MPDYLFSATNQYGQTGHDRIIADSAEHAVELLRDAQFTDIKLHNDDTSFPGIAPQRFRRLPAHLLVQAISDFNRSRHPSTAIIRVYRRFSPVLILAALLFALNHLRSSPSPAADYALLTLCLFPLVFCVTLSFRMRFCRELRRAEIEARWNDVLQLLPTLHRQMHRAGRQADLECTCSRANALLHLGRREEADVAIKSLRSLPGIPPWVYLFRLARFHAAAEEFEEARRCAAESASLAPEQPLPWMTLTEMLAVRLGRPAEARDALEHLKHIPLTDETKAGFPYVEGAIALEEGRLADARSSLETARQYFIRLTRKIPQSLRMQRVVEALLCITCAKMGDLPAAHSYFDASSPFLKLHKSEALLARCHSALAAAAPTESPTT